MSDQPAAHLDATKLLDAAPDAILVVDSHAKIAVMNVQAERMFGYARQELIGAPLEQLIPAAVRGVHAQHVARYLAEPNTRAMGSGLSLHGLRKDGTEIEIEVSLGPLPGADGDYVCAAVRDVSERRRIEAAAKLNADRLTSAVESIEDALALYDGDDRLVLCNSAYRMLVGASVQGPMVGERFEQLLDAWLPSLAFESASARATHRTARLAARGQPTVAFDVRTEDRRHLRVTARGTAEGGTVETIWDLSADMRLAAELREARAAADAASSAKSEFLSAMSHELRTPLNAILGFAQLLQRDRKQPLQERHRERIEHILKGGQHLLRLIDEILDLSRIESGRVPISLEPVEVADVLTEVQATLAPMAENYGIKLTVAELPAGLPRIVADRVRFKQVLMNFGSNAIKYGRSGGQALVSVARRDGVVRTSVRDDGTGISLDKQSRIFEPFYRAGQELGAIEGTGIGLALSKRLAELMAGSIGFESRPGDGSEFWIELPVQPEPEIVEHQRSLHTQSAGMRLKATTGPKHVVLYVEDNPSNIAFMEDLMDEFDGVELVTAPTAEIGIEIARQRTPRAIIMDINLPGISGLEATRRLKTWPETCQIPVIALSAAATARDAAKAADVGFHCYLTKPVEVAKLVTALEEILLPSK